MKKSEKIQTRIATILGISNEAEVLSEMRRYAESLTEEEFRFAQEYADDFLAKRSAAVREAFIEAVRSGYRESLR
jgi:hypothetical protein